MVESSRKLIDAVKFCNLRDVNKYLDGADKTVLEECRQIAKRQLASASKWSDPDEREKAEEDLKKLLEIIKNAMN
jgi:hypothetical protein